MKHLTEKEWKVLERLAQNLLNSLERDPMGGFFCTVSDTIIDDEVDVLKKVAYEKG